MKGLSRYKQMFLQLVIVAICCSTADSSHWLGLRAYINRPDDHKEHVVVACEEDKLFLQCNNRYNKLRLTHVFYGRDDTKTCRSRVLNSDSMCDRANANSIARKVHLMCSGENRCKIPVTAAFLARDGQDECPHIRKYLRVIYSCHQRPHIDMTCHNGCHDQCWPLCQQSCCHPSSPLPFQSAHDPVTSYQTSVGSLLPASSCPSGCPGSCAPLCFPGCCNPVSSIFQPLQNIPVIITAPPVFQPVPVPNAMQLSPMYLQQQPIAPNPPLTPQECPIGCSDVCSSYCPQPCCTRDSFERASQLASGMDFAPQTVQSLPTELEMSKRRSYMDILRRFREKQIADYYG